MASLASRSIAEGVGTALLVYFGAGAAATSLFSAMMLVIRVAVTGSLVRRHG